MQLMEAGEVSLGASASDHLPADFTFDTNGATIRQLLSHRSGILDWYDGAMGEQFAVDRTRVWEIDEVLAVVGSGRRPVGCSSTSPTRPPPTRWPCHGESRDALEKGGGYLPSLSDASADGPAGAMASDSISLAGGGRSALARSFRKPR
jgi:hypothetical protein